MELQYRPRSFLLGLAVSAAALAALAVAGRAAPRRAWPPLGAVALLPVVWLAGAAVGPAGSSAGGAKEVPAPPAPPAGLVDLAAIPDGATALGPGWWPAEAWTMGAAGRWTAGEAVLRLQRRRDEDGLVVDLSLDHPQGLTTGRIDVEGGPSQVLRAANGRHTLSLDLGRARGRTVTVRLVADRPFVPQAYDPSSGDGRALGMFVHSARLVPFSRCP